MAPTHGQHGQNYGLISKTEPEGSSAPDTLAPATTRASTHGQHGQSYGLVSKTGPKGSTEPAATETPPSAQGQHGQNYGLVSKTAPGTSPSPVNIVFVGAGAVGCFYASKLHHPSRNIHVSLIARSNYKPLAESGVKLQTHTFGDYTFIPSAVYPSVPAATSSSKEWDYVVVTTKALPDRTDDSSLIVPLVSSKTTIVLIQNGVGVEEQYRRRFPNSPIISAVTVLSAEQTSPGTIRQYRWTRIHMGPYTDSASMSEIKSQAAETTGVVDAVGSSDVQIDLARRGTEAVKRLADWMGRLGGIRDAEVTDEIGLQTIRWHKLCINAAFNPSSVLSGGIGNADMVMDPELRLHLAGVMKEIWDAVPRILGREDPFQGLAGPEKILKSTERNKGSKPSMLLDWEAKRPLEIEVILGNPVRIARARGVELPRMQSLYALLRSAQRLREKEVKGKL